MKKQANLLRDSLKLCRRALIYSFIFSFFINIFMLATSIYSLQVLDRVLSSNSYETLLMLSFIMLIIYVLLTIMQNIRALMFIQIANWLDKRLSNTLLKNSINFKNEGSQNLRDLNQIKSFITGNAIIQLFDGPWAIIYFIVIFFIHWVNGLITVIGAIVICLLAYANEKLTKKFIEEGNEHNILAMKQVESISKNAEVIKAMNMKKQLTEVWQESNQKYLEHNTKVNITTSVIGNSTKSIRLLIQMVNMAIGAVLVMQNKMSVGGIIAVSILSGRALMPFNALVMIYKSIALAAKSYERLNIALDNYHGSDDDLIQLPKPEGYLHIEKMIYKLNDTMIIKGVNIKINAGEIIGITGPSGSGKTTLARLIVGVLSPTQGSVRLDSAEIHRHHNEELGKYIGYLPQNVELFYGNVKDNIARMDRNANSERIIEAAKFANIHELILSLPNGYETNVGEEGNNLSGGIKQRIALARAFYGESKFVVLDEPNSNLDVEGEASLVKTIENVKSKNITTIIISHKPSILHYTDKILVLYSGEAKMFDKTEEVFKHLLQTNMK